MESERLEILSSHLYLGVTYASDMRGNKHCKNIPNSATRVLNTVRRTALVRPKLEYSSPEWNRTDTFKKSFYPRSIRLWNMLPSELYLIHGTDKFHSVCQTVVKGLSQPSTVLFI